MIAVEVNSLNSTISSLESRALSEGTTQNYSEENQRDEEQVVKTFDVKLFAGMFRLCTTICKVLLVLLGFCDVVDYQKNYRGKEIQRHQVNGGPEEWNTTQEAHEEWWVTNRG